MRGGESSSPPPFVVVVVGFVLGFERTALWNQTLLRPPPPQCFLACHKRCLETLAIQCGHKKLQGRLQLFGRDFSQVAAGDGVPFIVTKCISELERRALKMKVSGNLFFFFLGLSIILPCVY